MNKPVQLVLVVVLGVLVLVGVLVQGAPKPPSTMVLFAAEHEVVHLSQTELRGPFGTRTLPAGGTLVVEVTGGGTLEVGALSWPGALELSAHRLTVAGQVSATRVRFSAEELLYVDKAAELNAREADLAARVVVNIGAVRGERRIGIVGDHVMNQGVLGAPGGEVSITFGSHYLESRRGSIDVSGDEDGGAIRIAGGPDAHLFSSGRHRASGRRGGSIALDAARMELAGASLDVSGLEGGGHIDVGGDTRRLAVRGGALVADGTEAGSGGRIVLASLDATLFAGHASSRGGRVAGDGGFIDVSSAGEVALSGRVVTDAPMGHAGTLVLDPKNITIGAPQELLSIELVDPSPFAGDEFGGQTESLASGNIVVTDARDDFAAPEAGAVHLFSGQDGALLATLLGSTVDDRVGENVTALANGNYVVASPHWDNGGAVDAGAATWGDGTTGIAGAVAAANSLVGTTPNDVVGLGATALANGNYVIRSPVWDNGSTQNAGAATWGDGTTGITGAVSTANSLVGTSANDNVGSDVTALSNGNYVVMTLSWDNGGAINAGAATWGDGATGTAGAVSAANSLVGTSANDSSNAVVWPLSNGNYVVARALWNNGGAAFAGAVTWCNGATGVAGAVSAANSLVGTSANDNVGASVTALSNGNYVVRSPTWDSGGVVNAGAATWGNGAGGVVGTVSAANSLVGTTSGSNVGAVVTELANGNYVVASPGWDNGAAVNAGAATWGSGASGIAGAVSTANSLVGTSAGDGVGSGVTVLTNGNYVVRSTLWDNGIAADVGAATWGNGASGIVGAVSAANSLVGTSAGDSVGFNVAALTNGNYVVASPSWDNSGVVDAGAATWGNGTSGIIGAVSAGNSLVGASAGDGVGDFVTALTNGNYVVMSRPWNNGGVVDAGAATWGDGASGITGAVSTANSLVGTSTSDGAACIVLPLPNGNYVVASYLWDNGGVVDGGAAAWGNGTSGITGAFSAANSLVGTSAGDRVGSNGVTALSNGNYVVRSPEWDHGGAVDAGAATWGDGASGSAGAVSAGNSLVGTVANDYVGDKVMALSNGDYVVTSRDWDNGAAADAGALTLGHGITGVSGPVSAQNSLLGSWPGGGEDCRASEGAPTSFIGSFPNAGSVHLVIISFETVQPSYGLLPSSSITVPPEAIVSVLSQGADVVLEASNDLVVDAPLLSDNPDGDGGSLTLSAGRELRLDADIVTGGGNLTLVANDVLASGVVDAERDPGAGGIVWGDGVSVDLGAGVLSLEVRDGAGKISSESGALELGDATADAVFAHVRGADLLLQGTMQATGAGDAIVLVTDTALAVEAGSLDTPHGRFLVYAPSPEAVDPGGLVFSFEEFGKTYPDEPEPEHDGSGILYASPDPGSGGQGGEGGEAGTPAPPAEDDGCGCHTAGSAPGSAIGAWVVVMGALAWLRRRRQVDSRRTHESDAA